MHFVPFQLVQEVRRHEFFVAPHNPISVCFVCHQDMKRGWGNFIEIQFIPLPQKICLALGPEQLSVKQTYLLYSGIQLEGAGVPAQELSDTQS